MAERLSPNRRGKPAIACEECAVCWIGGIFICIAAIDPRAFA
jgi:hypothetical protein